MRKFDGVSVTDDIRLGRRRMRVTRLPRCLCLHMKRFTKVRAWGHCQDTRPASSPFPPSSINGH